MMFPVAAFASRPATLTLASAVVDEGPPSMTNAEKLGLDPDTAVGTQVNVTDAYTVTEAGIADANGVYVPIGPNPINGGVYSDTQVYKNFATGYTLGIGGYRPDIEGGIATFQWLLNSGGDINGGTPVYWGDQAETTLRPEEMSWNTIAPNGGIDPPPVFTLGAVQQLAAPSTAQGGVFVSGGDADGICAIIGTFNARPLFKLLGAVGDDPDNDPSGLAYWSGSRWRMFDTSGIPLYYSLSDEATPDLASDWKNDDHDGTPADITVTSVTKGELYAGLAITNDGVTNGSSYVSQPFQGRQYYMGLNGGGSNNMHWDTDFNVWTDDVGVWTFVNVAFPWQGPDGHSSHNGATFSRNDVANEANWQVIP